MKKKNTNEKPKSKYIKLDKSNGMRRENHRHCGQPDCVYVILPSELNQFYIDSAVFQSN